MKIIDTKEEKTTTLYVVEVDSKLWIDKQAKTKKNLIENLEVPGFRKGHAPQRVIDEKVNDTEVIQRSTNNVINKTIDEFWVEFDKNPNMNVIQQSLTVDFEKITPKELILKFLFENKPEIIIEGYDKIKIKYEKPTVSDKEINYEINNLIRNDYMLSPKEEPIAIGDMVRFDFKGLKDGKPFEGGEAHDYELEIGSGAFIPGFEEQMVGLKKGDKKTIDVIFPKDYHEKSLAGKPVKFELEIKEVSSITRPEITKEYLTKFQIPDVKNEKELGEFFRNYILRMKNQAAKADATNTIREYLINHVELSFVPNIILSQAKDRIRNEIVEQAKQANKPFEEYIKSINYKSIQDFEEVSTKDALKDIKYSFAMTKLIHDLGIKVEDKDIDKEFESISAMYHIPVEKMKENMGMAERIRNYLLEEKLFDKLIELNNK